MASQKEKKKNWWWLVFVAIIIFLITVSGIIIWQTMTMTVKYGTPSYRPKINN